MNKNITKRLTIIILLLGILLVALSAGGEGEASTLGSFTTYDLWGKEVDQTIFTHNTLTLVNVWATFCPPCLQEMPALGELSREYQTKGVGILGFVTDVSMDGRNHQLALQIVEQTEATYPHLLISSQLLKTRLGRVQAVPETFFVDNQGRIVGSTHVGARSKSAWKTLIDQYLAAVSN